MSEDYGAYSATLKASTSGDAPWIVVRAETAEQLHDRVKALQESGMFATLGSAVKDFQAQWTLGKQLGAEPVNPPKEPAKKSAPKVAKKAPEKPAEETPGTNWTGEPAVTEKPAEKPSAAPASGGRPKPAWKKG